MNDHDPVFGSIAALNPVPNENDLPIGAMNAAALLGAIDGRENMLDTRDPLTKPVPRRRWKGAWAAAAAFLAVLLMAVAIYAIGPFGDPPDVAPTPAPTTTETPATSTTTVAPTTTAASTAAATPASDVALFETAVAAWFSNDFDTVSKVLAIPAKQGSHNDWTSQETQALMEYDALVEARVEDLSCSAPSSAGGFFACKLTYANALTDAAALTPDPIEVSIRVEDGMVARYEFGNEEYAARYDLLSSFGAYTATQGRVPDGYLDCLGESLRFLGRPNAGCAQAQLSDLDGWLEWTTTVSTTEIVSAYTAALFSNDCTPYYLLEYQLGSDCPTDATEYEQALSASVDVDDCQSLAVEDPEDWNIACRVSYSNVLNAAVGAGPAVMTVRFYMDPSSPLMKTVSMEDARSTYPTDEAMLDSFAAFAESSGLGDAMAEACTINFPERSAGCASFILEHLDDWAAWAESN